MTYQVTARKWRPQLFDEVVGQEHVVKTLKNAILQNRLAHAYLFSGTRGVGKTTIARVLAKSINCANGPTITPCEKCDSCIEISKGNSMDVMEIDGASNNSVEDIRELRENVKYAPAKSLYKVYIIDEVHMLSKSAFNALLKTLEEPPKHVKFIFATTEENKIPETITSRCQCFEFRHISLKDIIFQLKKITESDGIAVDEDSLALIARTAEGSMRDAESILDQVISFAGKEIKRDDIATILGMVGFDSIAIFVDKIIDKKPSPLLEHFQESVFQGQDLHLFLKELMEYVRNIIVLKTSKEPNKLISLSQVEMDRLKGQVEKVSLDELHQIFKIISDVELGAKRSSYPVMLIEMALIRLTEIRPFQSIDTILNNLTQIEQEMKSQNPYPPSQNEIEQEMKSQNPYPPSQNEKEKACPDSPDSLEKEGDKGNIDNEKIWEKIKIKTKEKKDHLGMFLDNSKLIKLTNNSIEIGFLDKFTLQRMEAEENKKLLISAVEEVLNEKARIILRDSSNQTAKEPINKKKDLKQDEVNESGKEIIQEAIDVFGGEVIQEK